MRTIRTIHRTIATTAVVAMMGGAAANAGVTDIDVTQTSGDLLFANVTRTCFNKDDTKAHFKLDTLVVTEPISSLGQGSSGGHPGVAWWDLEIKVTRDTPKDAAGNEIDQDEMISIDKDVTNNTDLPWHDFHITLGTGLGDNFVESNETDFLFFKTDPNPPQEKSGQFKLLGFDEPNAPDNVWFKVNGPDFGPNSLLAANFWLAMNVPDAFFTPAGADVQMATFTVRQHATIPEPATLAMLGFGLAAVGFVRRRRA